MAQENTELVQQAYEKFRSGDILTVLSLLSEDVVWRLPEMEGVPVGGKRRGREAVGQWFATLADTQEALHFEPREFVAQGDKVIALGHYAWLVKETGRVLESDFVHVFTVRSGEIAAFQEYADTARIADAYR